MNGLKYFAFIKTTGETLFSHSFDEEVERDLIGAVVTAIYSFGVSSLKEQMSKMTMETKTARLETFHYKNGHDQELITVAFLNQDINKESFGKFATTASNLFLELHGNNLLNWDGEITQFSSFRLVLENLIQEAFSEATYGFDSKMDDLFDKILDGDLSGIDDL